MADDVGDDEGPEDPFPGMPFGFDLSGFDLAGFDLSSIDFNMLASALQSSGPLNWQVAGQIAGTVATGGEAEPTVDASTRAELEELAHAAQTNVVAETGLAATFVTSVRTLDRADWAALHLDALKPVLESLATTLGSAFNADQLLADAPMEGAEAIASILPMLGPLLLGVQAGSMIGYLAQHALGRYDLPLPAADQPSLCFVVRNIDEFQSDWSLERTDLRFYVAIHEVVHAAERSVPWVRQRMLDLATEYVSAYDVDPTNLSIRFGDIDPTDPASLQSLTDHPDELLGAMRSDRQLEILQRVRVMHAVLESYADVVLARVGGRLIPSFDQIHEAMARHRLERGGADRFVEGLLGLATEREDYERGDAFCAGVIERAGIDALHRLWDGPELTPTPNELDAPGLWLARIDLDL